mgnify:FL=1
MAEYMKATEDGNVPMTAEEIADLIATRESVQADKIERNALRTREAAKQYIDKYITGVRLALLSAGVAANRPKAKAVARWCKAIYTESFKREEACRLGQPLDTDFSSFGEIPHTAVELDAELEDLYAES